MRLVDVLDLLASGASEAEILDDYPYLSREDLEACFQYIRRFFGHPVVDSA